MAFAVAVVTHGLFKGAVLRYPVIVVMVPATTNGYGCQVGGRCKRKPLSRCSGQAAEGLTPAVIAVADRTGGVWGGSSAGRATAHATRSRPVVSKLVMRAAGPDSAYMNMRRKAGLAGLHPSLTVRPGAQSQVESAVPAALAGQDLVINLASENMAWFDTYGTRSVLVHLPRWPLHTASPSTLDRSAVLNRWPMRGPAC